MLETRTALVFLLFATACSTPSAQPDSGGNLDGGARSDMGSANGTGNDDLVSIELVGALSSRPALVNGLSAIGVGTQLDYVVRGRNSLGRTIPVSGVTFSTTTPDRIRWVERAGVVSVIGLAPGKARFVATAPTSMSSLVAIQELHVAEPEKVLLEAWTVQDDSPYESEFDRVGNMPQGPPSVAVDIPVRTYVRLSFSLLREDGLLSEGRADLAPTDIDFSIVSGAATVDDNGVIHASAIGNVSVKAALTGADFATVAPAMATAAFSEDAPLLGLEVCSVYGTNGYDQCHRSTRAGASPLVTTLSSDLTVLPITQDHPAPRVLLRETYAGEGVKYHRWLAPSDYTVRTSGDTSAVAIAADGQTEWLGPGVALWTATASGFDAPVLLAASYPVGTATSFRYEPSPIHLVGPPAPLIDCEPHKGIITVAGVDREITPFESLAVVRQPVDSPFVGESMLENAATGLDFCIPLYAYQVGLSSPVLGTFRVWFLPNELQFNALLSYRVDL